MNLYEGDEYGHGVDRARAVLNQAMLAFCNAEAQQLEIPIGLTMVSVTVFVHAFAEVLAIAMVSIEKKRDAADLKEMFKLMLDMMVCAGDPAIEWGCKERKQRKRKQR